MQKKRMAELIMKDTENLTHVHARHGFTLVELVVAILVFSLGIMGILKMHQASIQSNNFSQQLTEAVNLADDQIETLRGAGFDAADMAVAAHATNGTALRGTQYNVSYRVENVAGQAGLRRITVFVRWQEKATPHLLSIPIVINEL